MKKPTAPPKEESFVTIEEYNEINGYTLKHGITTGSCALAGAKAALLLLLGEETDEVCIRTPKGIGLRIPVFFSKIEGETAVCAVKKYAGDDPDCTDGISVFARVSLLETAEKPEIFLEGGEGVGRATKAGLPVPVGEAAINPVPRKMIRDSLLEILQKYGISRDIQVEIFSPDGAERAKRTFNSRLGIEGGISILGTSGFVLPMSREAIVETIKREMGVHLHESAYLLASPGNYGRSFAKTYLKLPREKGMECSNYLGVLLDEAVYQKAEGLLLVGHIGKLVKLAGGIMNTHSYESDAKMEILAAHVLRSEKAGRKAGAERAYVLSKKLLNANTTPEAVSLIKEAGILTPVMESLIQAMMFHAKGRIRRAMDRCGRKNPMDFGILLFSLEEGLLAKAGEIDGIAREIRKD